MQYSLVVYLESQSQFSNLFSEVSFRSLNIIEVVLPKLRVDVDSSDELLFFKPEAAHVSVETLSK